MKTSKKDNIAECEAVALKHDSQAVIIVRVERDGVITVSTYGETKKKCAVIGKWAQKLFDLNLTAVPFTTIFGWGTKGVPTPLTDAQLDSLSVNTREALKDWL